MLNKLLSLFRNEKFVPLGLGCTKLPNSYYETKYSLEHTQFKELMNKHFFPRVSSVGFKGKDFYYYREQDGYTEVLYIWTYKYGGAIQADLLVKYNGIDYPGEKKVSVKSIRPLNAEFQNRLSPNGEKNKQGQDVWFWVIQSNDDSNIKIVEDIWRVFNIRGLEFYKRFENDEILNNITPINFKQVKEFHLGILFGRRLKGLLYFLSKYYKSKGDSNKALEFALLGEKELEKIDDDYQNAFKEFIR